MARFLIVDLAAMGEHHSQIVKAPNADTAIRAYLGSFGIFNNEQDYARNLIENGELEAIEIKPTAKLVVDKTTKLYSGPTSWEDGE